LSFDKNKFSVRIIIRGRLESVGWNNASGLQSRDGTQCVAILIDGLKEEKLPVRNRLQEKIRTACIRYEKKKKRIVLNSR